MSAREVYDGNSLYRIKGLDERADLIEAAADGLSESLAGTVAAARTALGDWTGPLAVSFAAQFNTVASRIVTLHLTARAAAATCRNFPDAVPSSRIAADYEYMGARVDAATSTAVSADPATMTTAGGKLAALRSLPSEAQLEHFFRANFADGDGTIRDGFAAYVASMDETDPVARQRLVYQGNVEVAIHEQAGAQVYLERANWGPDGIAAFFVDAQVGDQHLDLNVDLPQRAGANNLIWDEPILSMDVGGKTAADFSAGDSRFAVGASPSPTIGVVDVDPIAGTEMYRPDFSPSSKVWFERGGPLQYVQDPYGQQYQLPTDPEALDGTGAATWPDWNQRMNSISRMFEQYHTETTLYDTSEIGVSLHGISWLDSSSIPR